MRNYHYIGPKKSLLAALQMPFDQEATTPSLGVVICYPLGHEHTHSFSTMVQLAETFAGKGIASIRCDYPGTGNSSGKLQETADLSEFVSAQVEAAHYLRTHCGVSKICYFGVRMGGTIAALAAEKSPDCLLAVWNPCLDGRAFIRDLEIMRDTGPADDPAMLNSGGFLYSRPLLDSIAKVQLKSRDYSQVQEMLFIDRSDHPTGARFCEAISHKGLNVHRHEASGYALTMRQPQFSLVADEVITHCCRFLTAQQEPSSIVPPDISGETSGTMTTPLGTETAIKIPSANGSLFGILSVPPNEQPSSVVVLPNTGAAHNIGPGRLHVEIARALQAEGIASLRMDLSNIGESVGGATPNLNNPYPPHAVTDIKAGTSFLRKQFPASSIVLCGLCSGAHASFQLALTSSEEIRKIILINAESYDETPRSLSPDLLHTHQKGSVVSRAARKGSRKLSAALRLSVRTLRNLLIAVKIRPPTPMTLNTLAIDRKGTAVDFVFSEHDDGKQLLANLCGPSLGQLVGRPNISIHHLPEADHTFTNAVHRSLLVARLTALIQRNKS